MGGSLKQARQDLVDVKPRNLFEGCPADACYEHKFRNDAPTAVNKQWVQTLNGIPLQQRQAYVQAHRQPQLPRNKPQLKRPTATEQSAKESSLRSKSARSSSQTSVDFSQHPAEGTSKQEQSLSSAKQLQAFDMVQLIRKQT